MSPRPDASRAAAAVDKAERSEAAFSVDPSSVSPDPAISSIAGAAEPETEPEYDSAEWWKAVAQGLARKLWPVAAIPDGHPEAICERCGGPNVVWFAPNDLWNRVIGSPEGIVCPRCFVLAAEAKGIDEIWSLAPSNATLEARLRDAERERLALTDDVRAAICRIADGEARGADWDLLDLYAGALDGTRTSRPDGAA